MNAAQHIETAAEAEAIGELFSASAHLRAALKELEDRILESRADEAGVVRGQP